jgi:hypothetical protein
MINLLLSRIRVYEVGPLLGDPTIRPVAEVKCKRSDPAIYPVFIQDEKVVIVTGESIIVWDYQNCLSIAWSDSESIKPAGFLRVGS